MITQEELTHDTPAGGDHSVIYYFDSEGRPSDKSKATKVEIAEFLGTQEIARTYGTIGEPTANVSEDQPRLVTYYHDKNGKPCPKAQATHAEIVEYRGGKETMRIYGRLRA